MHSHEVTLGRFHLERRLGRGSMGEVFLARDGVLGDRVALKRLVVSTPDEILRLKREFRTLADLAHPNLARLYELVDVDGTWAFTMEPVEGVGFVADALAAGDHGRVLDGADDVSTLDPEGRGDVAPLDGDPAALVDRVARLRVTLPGLARGLAALHAAGLTHGDVKPSNVLVEPEGRVVLLDFGLVQRVDPGPNPHVEGTLLYVAPEVLLGEGRRPAADWWAVGTLLHEVLTGRLPDEGTLGSVLGRRMAHAQAPEVVLPDDAPADLVALVRGLLERDPDARLGAADVLAWAGADPSCPTETGDVFVGRRLQLERLREVLDTPGARVVVLGRSGTGKSTLLRRFVDDVATPAGALVLEGVCHDREAVRFNAFDRVIDQLVAALAPVAEAERDGLLPPGLEQAAVMFPVLGALVRPATGAPAPRQVAWEALRALLTRLSARQPVVLVLDDVQWADGDSLQLLKALLEPPAAPSVRVVLACRDGADAAAPLEPLLTNLGFDARVTVDRLDPDEAGALAASLGLAVATDEVARLVEEADGNPFLVDQALRFGRGGSVAALLDERVAALSDDERALLATASVAGEPLRLDAALRVSGVTRDVAAVLGALRRGRLLRTHGPRASDRVEAYHAQVAERVVGGLPDSVRAGLHRRLSDDVAARDPEAMGALAALAVADDPGVVQAAGRALSAVRHLRAAHDLDPGAADADRLLRLELGAAVAARQGRAYAAAVDFARRAVGLLPADAWTRDRALAWRAHVELARALASDADFAGSLAVVEGLLPRAADVDERVVALRLRLQALVAAQEMATALDVALDALALLGTRLPRRPRPWHVLGALARTKLALRGRAAASLRALPGMTDPSARAAVAIERRLLTACFVAEPDLFPILVFDLVRKTLAHGHAPESAAGWVAYGLVLSGFLGDPEGGHAFGELADHVVDDLGAKDQRAVVDGIAGGFLLHWVGPLTATMPVLDRGWRAGTAAGDFEFAGMCASIGAYQRWFAGRPLAETHALASAAAEVLPRLGQDRTSADLTRLLQLCASTRGEDDTAPPWTLRGRSFDPDATLQRQIEAGDRSNLASLRYFLGWLAYVHGDLERAVEQVELAEQDMAALVGTVNLVAHVFLSGLVHLAIATRRSGSVRRRALAAGVRARKRLAGWARRGPAWLAHLHELVLAEELRVRGDRRGAAAAYERALAGAAAEGFLHHEALAAEAAARFHLDDDPECARAMWDRARDAWTRWGAVARVTGMTAEPDPWTSRGLPPWSPRV